MGAVVKIIPTSDTILMTDAPVLELYTHMNIVYLWLKPNSECDRGQDYSTITIVLTPYGEDADGNLDRTKALPSWSKTYKRFQINQVQELDGFPPYNIWAALNNHWYEIQLHFNFQLNSNAIGANDYQSKISTFSFDNRNTTLTNTEASNYFLGLLKDNLGYKDNFNIWFGTKDDWDHWDLQEYDLLARPDGGSMRQINNITGVTPNQTFQLLASNLDYESIVRYIMNNDRTAGIFLKYFGDTAPAATSPEAIFTFCLYLNQRNYYINFRGNLQFMIDRARTQIDEKEDEKEANE